jgi:polyhydroxybutyrate depolymerase
MAAECRCFEAVVQQSSMYKYWLMSLRALFLALLLAGCPPPPPPPPVVDAGCQPGGVARPDQIVFGGARPVTLQVPRAYDPACAAPLVVLLHGYGAAGILEEGYLGLGSLVDGRGVLLAAPDGTVDSSGSAFWNAANEACCNFSGSTVDDVKYLGDLITGIRAVYNVDPKRIFLVGHSNGGFMAHTLACELSDDIAAVVSLAGTVAVSSPACHPSAAVSVLQIHGDQDAIVFFDGGTNVVGKGGGPYAGALETTSRWASADGCQATFTAGMPFDLEAGLPGAETDVSTFDGCPAGTDVTLWTIRGGGHSPMFSGKFAGPVWRWLAAHPRP